MIIMLRRIITRFHHSRATLIQQQHRQQQQTIIRRTISSSTTTFHKDTTSTNTTNILTPSEAAQRAQILAKQNILTVTLKSKSNHIQSMDTTLSHSGFVDYEKDNNNIINNNEIDDNNIENLNMSHKNHYNHRPHNEPIVAPMFLSTTYIRPIHGSYHPIYDSIYIRHNNPTRTLFEQQMSILELVSSTSSSTTRTTTQIDPHNNNNTSYSFAMSSGMMAISTIIMAHSLPIHIILPIDTYHGVPSLLENVYIPFTTTTNNNSNNNNNIKKNNNTSSMITYERVDMRNIQLLTKALQNISNDINVIVWIETPSNPLCHVIDIEKTCQLIRSIRPNNTNNINNMNDHDHDTTGTTTIVVDSTLAPPNITQPLLIGTTNNNNTTTTSSSNNNNVDHNTINNVTNIDYVDIVVHSATKYIGGHSDAMGGIVTVSPYTKLGQQLYPVLQSIHVNQGGIMSSMDSYMMLRGLRTLHIRVIRQSQTALIIANYFYNIQQKEQAEYGTPIIKKVYYPGLEPSSNDDDVTNYELYKEQYNIAQKQMNNQLYGGVLSVEFYNEIYAMAFIGALQIILRATSLGGTETLIEHRASIEPESIRTSPNGLVRIAVGLEDPNDLLYDIQNAIQIMKVVCNVRNDIDTNKSK